MSRKNEIKNKDKDCYSNKISNMEDSFEAAEELGEFPLKEFKQQFKSAKENSKNSSKYNCKK